MKWTPIPVNIKLEIMVSDLARVGDELVIIQAFNNSCRETNAPHYHLSHGSDSRNPDRTNYEIYAVERRRISDLFQQLFAQDYIQSIKCEIK